MPQKAKSRPAPLRYNYTKHMEIATMTTATPTVTLDDLLRLGPDSRALLPDLE
jgi:hypothetical protein